MKIKKIASSLCTCCTLRYRAMMDCRCNELKPATPRTMYFKRRYEQNKLYRLMQVKARQRAAKGLYGPPNPPKMPKPTLADKLAAYRNS
jgi:hypothetical protein